MSLSLSQLAKRSLGAGPAPMERKVRSVVRALRRRFSSRTAKRRYGPFQLTIDLIDLKGASWYDRDRDLEPEIELLCSRSLRRGALVFDLGAHQGVVAIALAKLVGPEGRVIGVEGHPRDAAAAARNAALNECTNLTILNTAISDRTGVLEFETEGRVATGNRRQPIVTVPSRTIDDLAQEYGRPDILFIDVDGFEVHALRGAADVLSNRPDCYVEVHGHLLPQYGCNAMDVVDIFREHSYELFVSAETRPSRRQFRPLLGHEIDLKTSFHLVAFA